MVTETNNEFPLNDKGEEAAVIITTQGMVFPFWGIRNGWAGLVEGGEYLLLAVDTSTLAPENVVPGKDAVMAFYPEKHLDLTHWALIAAQARHDGHNPTVIRVLWNTGEEFQYENVLLPDGKRTLSYSGKISSGVTGQ